MAARKRKQAKKVKQRKPKYTAFPTDAESITLRREGAEKEKARVMRLDAPDDGFYGSFEVSSTQWEHPYVVEIRSLALPLNTCSCQDHRMNRLGTCKHIERVLQFLAHRRKRRFKAAAEEGCKTYEIFFDEREYPPLLKLLRPTSSIAAVEKHLAHLFSADGTLLGRPSEAWPSLERVIAGIPARTRAKVRVSRHCEYWLACERRELEQRCLLRRFEEDVAAGKRSDNPVNLPLYPYQKQGMMHLAFRGRALLADEMGLGKTVQAIAASELLRQIGEVRRVLVVSPASLKAEWEDQIMQFTGIQAVPVYGPREKRLRNYAAEQVYTLCNYEQIRVDMDDINRLMVPDIVILDEAQRIKNWPTKTAKTIKRLSSPHAFVLTGTPLENRIEELYSLVEFVDPHVFGSLFRFQRDYMEIGPENDIRPKNLDRLHRKVSGVMLRRRKSDVEDSLPERTDKNFFVSMTKEQKIRYGENEYEVAKLVAILKRRPLRKVEHDRLQMFLACMRMTCDTPYILDQECRDCPKLDELGNILDDVLDDEAAKIIVFSEWVRMLDLVKELLDAKGIEYAEHTGKVPQKKRREQIKRFKEDAACRLFLSSESGGTGLNLQAANVVINLDLPWNPAKLEQRIARAWRKHQKRSVRVINLVSSGTIEEAMLDKLAYKTALADSVLDGVEFQESLRSASGRQSFAARVGELLGGESLLTAEPRKKRGKLSLEDVLSAQFADSVLGIEKKPDTGASVVVARPGSNIDAVRNASLRALDGKAVVITPEIKALLLRLQEIGVLTLSPQLVAVHTAEGYAPFADEVAEPPTLDYTRARVKWKSVQSELRAAQALSDIGLNDQAVPHTVEALQEGRAVIAALYDCEPGDMPEDAAAEHREILERIEETIGGEYEALARVTRGLSLADEIGDLLHPVDQV